MAFNWQELLDDIIEHRRVIPVIGLDLVDVPGLGGPLPFYRQLAARTAEKLRADGIEGLPVDAEWATFMAAAMGGARPVNRGVVSQAVDEAHRELLAAVSPEMLPEPLRLLAKITDFPLVLTTAIDGLVGRAFGVPAADLLASKLNDNADLPRGWQLPARGTAPTVVHLFGRIAAAPDFALTEEDVLEFMRNLQGGQAPRELLSRLNSSDLLLLGTRFPDWLARFFIRLLRGVRLSDQNRQRFEAMADHAEGTQQPLVAFLKKYSLRTRIYEEGTAADFVRTLLKKWEEARKNAAAAVARDLKLDEMREGSIFISYASEDRGAAIALAEAFDRAQLDVWLDRNQLYVGDDYERVIRRNIGKCDLFVPVLSQNTSKREDAYFRKEWTCARLRLESIGPARPFMMPVVIDDLDVSQSLDIEHYFEIPGIRKVHVSRAPQGLPDKPTIDGFIDAIRQVRAPRLGAIAAAAP